MGETRRAVEQSWDAARRQSAVEWVVKANAATCAGQYLAAAKGDARRAWGMLPHGEGSAFWARVSTLLIEVEREDLAERGPRLAGTGVG